MSAAPPVPQAELLIDLDQFRQNLSALRGLAPTAAQLVVVKANGYGHGAVQIARAARDGGADWLGVAAPVEALALRQAGDRGPLLCWLESPGAPFADLAEAGVDVTVSSVEQLEEIVSTVQGRARVQLKIDTGLARGGAFGPAWTTLVEDAAAAQRAGRIEVTGVWSHFACADQPDLAVNDQQEKVFLAAVDELVAAGVEPGLRHLANSAAIISRPSSHFDLVRAGIAAYGLRPDPSMPVPGVRPVLTARASLAQVKRVPAGTSVSYGHTWTSASDTTLALVPVGYGDGIFRGASNRGEVCLGGVRLPVRGVICMDQFVVEAVDRGVERGDVVTLFGSGEEGEPTADEWAAAAGTIAYEIVTRLSSDRWTRTYVGER